MRFRAAAVHSFTSSSCAVWKGCTRRHSGQGEMRGAEASKTQQLRLIDIGANLLDDVYQGRYGGSQSHPPDLTAVLERSWATGVKGIMITAGRLSEAKEALHLARTDERLFCTVGCHPTRCGEFDNWQAGPGAYLQELLKTIEDGMADGKVVAVGECGLDYDRLHFCDKETQQRNFTRQFELTRATRLPMFLHMRAASENFIRILEEHKDDFFGGVVHSFTGTAEELQQLLRFPNLAIGINGCSLKTEENLDVMAAVPLDRLMLETDAPWCEIRNTHASRAFVQTSFEARDRKKYDPSKMVKSRNEPCTMRQVLEAVAGRRGISDLTALSEQVWSNTTTMFPTLAKALDS